MFKIFYKVRKVMLKELGRKKSIKEVKCKKCGKKIKIIQEEIETINGRRSTWCKICGTENVLKR